MVNINMVHKRCLNLQSVDTFRVLHGEIYVAFFHGFLSLAGSLLIISYFLVPY